MRDGLARAASAPAVLAGAIAVLWWLDGAPGGIGLATVSGAWNTRTTVEGFVLWTFLSGGIIDRYARRRPTRARGFFAACGAHFSAMVRLGLVLVLACTAWRSTAARTGDSYVATLAELLLLAVVLIVVYGQIRLVVEDRRSALGALLAAWRFVRRNPASTAPFLLFVGLVIAALFVLTATAPAPYQGAAAGLHKTAWLTVFTGLVLALYASGIALFQSRLAHAGYTAGPPLEWPESPAAEAIANASPLAP